MKYSTSIIVGLVFLTIIPLSYGQEITIGEKALQESVIVEIDVDGNMHVKHIVLPLSSPGSITLIDGTVSDIMVRDMDGNEKQFGTATGNNILLFPSKDKTIVEYDLADVLIQRDQFWVWSLEYVASVAVILPQEADLVYVNDNPIDVSSVNGIMCHGCSMNLQYSFVEPKTIQKVMWEDKEFLVEFRTVTEINQFKFDQPSKTISFETSGEGKLVTVVIPLELLWKPYKVFFNEEKLAQHEYTNGTHVWLTVKPDNSGVVSIIGTTVIPEFPLITPLMLAFSAIVLMPFLGRVIRR